MRCVVAIVMLGSAGCSALFGLESPKLGDAGTGDDAVTDGRPTDGRPTDGRLTDGGANDSPPSAVCPLTYAAIGSSATKYRFVDIQETWSNALANCNADLAQPSSLHTHLVVLASNAEVASVATIVQNNDVWIGLSDRKTEGTYLWVTDEAVSYPPASGAPWGIGEPNVSDAEDCVLAAGNSGFNMKSCTLTKRYVCECDAYPADPANY